MRAIIIAMLVVQAAMFLTTIYYVLFKRPAPPGAQSIWFGLWMGLIIVGAASWQIGDSHLGEQGADILLFGAPFMIGMGIMALLMTIRERRGIDASR
jgi:hypothetical protein